MSRIVASSLLIVHALFAPALAQHIYVVNNANELKMIDSSDFSVTPLFSIDIYEFGYITDLAFSPDGSLYGVTNARTLIRIDLAGESAQQLATLPEGGTYTSLVCNAQNELLTSKFLQQELYKYDLDSGQTTFLANGISSPGDFTFYKGNLIYPNIFNDFIKAWDGTELYNVGCSEPLLYTFVNVIGDCNDNTVYGIDENAVVYLYDLENDTREAVANLLSDTGPLFGGASRSEYLASQCPLEILNEVDCSLSTEQLQLDGISLESSLVGELLILEMEEERSLTFELIDVNGQRISGGRLNGKTISTAMLRSGLYFVRLEDPLENRLWVSKFIKK